MSMIEFSKKLRFALTAALIASGLAVWAAPSTGWTAEFGTCVDLFFVPVKIDFLPPSALPNVVYGTLRSDFQHNTRYTFEVKQHSDVKDQCQLGTCHLYSWASMIEQDFKVRTGRPFVVSTKYLAARFWLKRSLEELEKDESNVGKPGSRLKIQFGKPALASRDFIMEVGIVPDRAWTPKADFQAAPLSARMADYIENIIGRARLLRAGSPSQRETINAAARAAIEHLFETNIGPFPTQVTMDNRTYTPVEFVKAYFPSFLRTVVAVGRTDSDVARTSSPRRTEQSLSIDMNIAKMESLIVEVLKRGQNVFLRYQHDAQYVDRDSGLMSTGAFHVPPGAEPLSRREREIFDKTDGGHMVQIVGYELDHRTGRVKKWKIKNSWGEDAGDRGYYHMYADYFRTFATAIYFYENPAISLPTP